MREPAADDLTTKAVVDHNKRLEREELLKRAAKLLEKSRIDSNSLPTPPQSPRDGRTIPSDEPGKVPGREDSDGVGKTEKCTKTEKAWRRRETASPNEFNLVKLSSRHIDIVMDNVPDGLQMPDTVDNILIEPSATLKMEEISTAFDSLKVQIQTHCRQFYSYKKPAEDHAFPSFTYLRVKHPELFRYIQYVADGSQYGWDKLISVGPQRENLVYGILSRTLVAHIFDAELFGASAKHEETLLEMCRKYLNFDAFVRNTHRAEIIISILQYGAKGRPVSDQNKHTYFSSAIQALGSRIGLLLQPLQDPKDKPHLLQQSLLSILQTALKIHLAIRLAGLNGTVYRFEHVPKHSHWDSMTMNCLNQRKMDLTAHHGEEPLAKVSCFPTVYATVPSGPTLEKFEEPDFVEEWKQMADEEGSKPVITTYPITLADVVLERTPRDRSGFLTLNETMISEQTSMTDGEFLKLTGINRARRSRIHRIAKRATPKVASRAVASFGLAAAAGWSLYKNKDALHRLVAQAPWLFSYAAVAVATTARAARSLSAAKTAMI
jgi:hypothetical protein